MRTYILEGSPEEINKVLPTLETLRVKAVQPTESIKSEEGPTKFVTSKFAARTLVRRKRSPALEAVFSALYYAYPDRVSTSELYKAAGYDRPAQFAGLMGSFGRRIANTKGFDNEAFFFDYRWNEDANEWDYRLPDSVHKALVELGLF